jgi:hypothetical protein
MPSFRHTAALTVAAPFALALSLALTTSLKAQCPDQYVNTKIDRFSGAATMETQFRGAPLAGMTPNFSAIVSGQIKSSKLSFIGSFNSWRYLTCFATFILADGQRVATGKQEHVGDVGSGFVVELINVPLAAAAIAQLGAASKIEFKVCNDEMVAAPEFVQAAHEFACKVVGQKPAPNAAPAPTTPSPQKPPPAPATTAAGAGPSAAVSAEPAAVAPASPGFQRVAVAGTSLSYPYTVEIPSDWYIYQEGNPHSMLLLVPQGARNGDPDIIGIVACTMSLADPEQIVANLKRSLKGVRTVAVKEIDGVRGVLSEWDQGKDTVLGLMLPTSSGCVQFMGQSPRAQFAARRAQYERIIFSVRRAP